MSDYITTPHAFVRIYNYIDRLGSKDASSPNEVEVLDVHSDIIAIETSKTKSQPAGQFQIVLAPSKNWVTTLSPGSWISIHMSNSAKIETSLGSILKFSPSNLKMIGRIDSVRMNMQVDPLTGLRHTVFVMVGRDWGQVFEYNLYIDPLAFSSGDDALTKIVKLTFNSKILDAFKGKIVTSTTKLMQFLVELWSSQSVMAMFRKSFTSGGLDADRFVPDAALVLPNELVQDFMGINFGGSLSIIDHISYIVGVLTDYDTYEDKEETVGFLDVQSLIGNNNLWSLIVSHSSPVVNEVFAELVWDGDSPNLGLYKRVKPFVISKGVGGLAGLNLSSLGSFGGGSNKTADQISSPFFHVKKHKIESDRVMKIDVGNNWKDRVNFIEIMPTSSYLGPYAKDFGAAAQTLNRLADNATYDKESFSREGFRSLMYSSNFMPLNASQVIDGRECSKWIPILKEWYFDTHKYLNGTLIIVGMDEYLGVGDNVLLSASIFGKTSFVNGQSENSGFLAHIESVSHSFVLNDTGSKSYMTTIQFIRGIFTNEDGTALIDKDSYGIDTDAKDLLDSDELIATNIKTKG